MPTCPAHPASDFGWPTVGALADEYVPVFIGGIPRSGTTLLSALVSTSAACSPFAPEFHYFWALAQGLIALGLPNQTLFFAHRERVVDGLFALLQTALNEAWMTFGRPRYLVIKHCSLTPIFDILAQRFPRALFIATIRDPRYVVASLLRGILKAHPGTAPDRWLPTFGPECIKRYNATYSAFLRGAVAANQARFLAIHHRELCDRIVGPLNRFLGVEDIDPSLLWTRAVFDVHSLRRDPLFASGWGKPLGSERNDWFHDVLDGETAARILKKTAFVRSAFEQLIPPERSASLGIVPEQLSEADRP